MVNKGLVDGQAVLPADWLDKMQGDTVSVVDALGILTGAVDLPAPVKALMRAAAKVMTTVAHRI